VQASIVTCLIGVFDASANDEVLIQIPYSGSVIMPEAIVDESWLENAGLGDIGTGVRELELEVERGDESSAVEDVAKPGGDVPALAAPAADVANEPIEAAVSEAVNFGARESGPEGINAELGAAAVERIANVRSETPHRNEISVLREPAPLHIRPAVVLCCCCDPTKHLQQIELSPRGFVRPPWRTQGPRIGGHWAVCTLRSSSVRRSSFILSPRRAMPFPARRRSCAFRSRRVAT
jgi:hypothetical protein